MPETVITRVIAYKDKIDALATLHISYPQSKTDAIKCMLIFDDSADVAKVALSSDDGFFPSFQLRSADARRGYWVPRFVSHSTRHVIGEILYHGEADLLFEMTIQALSQKHSPVLECFAFLQEGGLTYRYLHERWKTLNLRWKTPFGEAQLIESGPENGQPMIRIQISQIHLPMDDLILDIVRYLDELMWPLSFLSKRYINYYQLHFLNSDYRIVKGYRNASIALRNLIPRGEWDWKREPSHLLIYPDAENVDQLSRLIELYFESPDRDTLKLLIQNILVTYEGNNLIEQDLGISYTSLETVVTHFSEDRYILSKRRFSKLKEEMSHLLRSGSNVDLTEFEIEEIKKKLPELRRYSFKTRVRRLFTSLIAQLPQPKQSEFQFDVAVFITEIEDAIGRRNKYIHTGIVPDTKTALRDISLLRFLVSIWIVSSLGCSISNVNEADQDYTEIWYFLPKKD